MKTQIVGRGVYGGVFEYSCVFGCASVDYFYGAWWIRCGWEYNHLFNLSFKTHTEAIVHLDKECYKYIQEAARYLRK